MIWLGSLGFSLTSVGKKGILWELEGFDVSVLTGRAELETKVLIQGLKLWVMKLIAEAF